MPTARWTAEISESSRNRLACSSSRASSASAMASTRARLYGGQAATRALVPRASRSATATMAVPMSIIAQPGPPGRLRISVSISCPV